MGKRGSPRAGRVVTGPVVLRPATPGDADILLEWANDPVTGSAGFHPRQITGDEHRAWLAARLASPVTRLFIGLADDAPVGQVRLERQEDGLVEISISVAPDARGRGLGGELLSLGIAAGRVAPAFEGAGYVAYVRPANAASVALFRAAGFTEAARTTVGEEPCLELRLA